MVEEEISEQGKANGKRENSSIQVSKNLLLEEEGKGPLKSMLRRSKG
jgi:hypothetical protein